jgi:hypothetical protein
VVTITPSRPLIRKRALYAVRALAECDPVVLGGLSPEIARCLRDKDQAVVGSALAVCSSLHKVGSSRSVLGQLSYIPRMGYWALIPSLKRIGYYSTMGNLPQVLQQRC